MELRLVLKSRPEAQLAAVGQGRPVELFGNDSIEIEVLLGCDSRWHSGFSTENSIEILQPIHRFYMTGHSSRRM